MMFGNYEVIHNDTELKSFVYKIEDTDRARWLVRIFGPNESAWSDAERYASDLMYADMYGKG